MFLLANVHMAIYLAAFHVEERDSVMTLPSVRADPGDSGRFQSEQNISHSLESGWGGDLHGSSSLYWWRITGASSSSLSSQCSLERFCKPFSQPSTSLFSLTCRESKRLLPHYRKLLTSSKSNHKPKHPDGARGSRGSEPGSRSTLIIPTLSPQPERILSISLLVSGLAAASDPDCVGNGGRLPACRPDWHHRFPPASTCCHLCMNLPSQSNFHIQTPRVSGFHEVRMVT